MPDGTTSNAQVALNIVAHAGMGQNESPIYVSGVMVSRDFLKWVRALCPSGLSAQIKGERLFVPPTADSFIATVSALQSLDGSKGFQFSHLLSAKGSLRESAN
jgi:hypothetical protein